MHAVSRAETLSAKAVEGMNVFATTCMVLIVAVVLGYSYLEQQKELQTASKCENNNFAVNSSQFALNCDISNLFFSTCTYKGD